MVTEVFAICDGANDSHGKLNILGAFDTIVSAEFPFVHSHCAIALRLRYDRTDGEESKIGLALQTQAGDAVLTSVETVVKHSLSANPTATANLIININSLRFDTPGDFSIMLQVDDLPAALIPLYVRPSQAR